MKEYHGNVNNARVFLRDPKVSSNTIKVPTWGLDILAINATLLRH